MLHLFQGLWTRRSGKRSPRCSPQPRCRTPRWSSPGRASAAPCQRFELNSELHRDLPIPKHCTWCHFASEAWLAWLVQRCMLQELLAPCVTLIMWPLPDPLAPLPRLLWPPALPNVAMTLTEVGCDNRKQKLDVTMGNSCRRENLSLAGWHLPYVAVDAQSQADCSTQGQRGKRKRVLRGVSGVSGVPAAGGRATSCMTAILGPSGVPHLMSQWAAHFQTVITLAMLVNS